MRRLPDTGSGGGLQHGEGVDRRWMLRIALAVVVVAAIVLLGKVSIMAFENVKARYPRAAAPADVPAYAHLIG